MSNARASLSGLAVKALAVVVLLIAAWILFKVVIGVVAAVAQLAIAWVLSRGEDVIPLIGSRRRDQFEEALGALELELSDDDLERIEAAVPAGAAAGQRYAAAQMATLDSER